MAAAAALTTRSVRLHAQSIVASPAAPHRLTDLILTPQRVSIRQFSQRLSSSPIHSKAPCNVLAVSSARQRTLQSRSLFTRRRPRPIRTAVLWSLLAFGATFGVAYHLDSRSAIHRWVAIPILQAVTDPETAQKLAIKLLSLGVMPNDMLTDDEVLATEIAGLKLSNPIGLAAGFDKQAEAIDGLLDLGFGLVEIGSVTPEPQPGNEQPRYFRLVADRAAINRYGFNSEGHEVILGRLRERIQRWLLHSSDLAKARIAVPDSESDTAHLLREADINTVLASNHLPRSLRPGQLLAVNLGKNKTSPEDSVDDYVKGVERLGSFADMIVVNVSSPNTPGLRGMQRKNILAGLMGDVVKARDRLHNKVPIFVKIAPDLEENELFDIADAALSSGIEGLVVSNTTISRPSNLLSPPEITNEKGGLSGAPVKPLALQAVQTMRKRVGDKVSIIGCGGIFSGEDALDFAKAGADAVELYTSFGYEGVGHPRRVKDELVSLLKAQGKTWKQSVGSGLQDKDFKSKLPSGEKDFGKIGGLEERFGEAVAGMKGELEDLRRSVGITTNSVTSSTEKEESTKNRLLKSSSPTVRPIFHPDPSDKEYTSLMDKVHEALGVKTDRFEKQKTMETGMTEAEALRAKLGIALQDPSIPPSAAIQGLGSNATVGESQPTAGRFEQPKETLRLVDVRGNAARTDREAETRLAMGKGRSDFDAADRARVV